MGKFVHLHAHSSYSLLQGAMTPQELVRAAAERGATAVALTDTNGLYGAMLFREAARQAGLRPIIGAEITWGSEQCVLLAADRQGYANLCRVITERQLGAADAAKAEGRSVKSEVRSMKSEVRGADAPEGGMHRTPAQPAGFAAASMSSVTSDFSLLTSDFVSPCPSSFIIHHSAFSIAQSVAADPRGLFVLTATPSLLQKLHGVVPPDRLYVELRADDPHSFETRCPALRGAGPVHDDARTLAADVAERLAIPPVATVNANFLAPAARHMHAVLSAIRENARLKDLLRDGRLLAGPHSFLMAPEQVAARLPAPVRDDAMRNSARIAEQCALEFEPGPHFPRADLPPGVSACERLREVACAGARRRYGRLTRPVRERLDYELGVIAKLDFCDYFLVVRDIVEFAERERIPHVGRGSAANSLVSYALGISAVDPLKFDLPFERFLNEFRTDVPDIDLDFCWRHRDDVIAYVYRRYGAERVAMVATHNTLRARSAFRDVARVMGLPQAEISRYSKLLPYYSGDALDETMESFPELAGFPAHEEPWRTVVETALRVDGYVRHLGIHLGGLVIGDRPLTWYAPLENSAKGIVVTQYEMHGIEATGLVKMDLLGQRSLSIVAEAARQIEEERGIRLDLDHLPDRDPQTAVLLREGRTMGCFQIESPGMRQLLQMLRAETIMDVVQGLSLIRPGPSSSGMKHAFIRRRLGEEPVRYPTPLLERALGATYGVMLYQEDILKVAREVAGFTLAEGDELRKAISKKRSLDEIRRSRERFVGGAVARGVAPDAAEEIWRRVEDFAAYSYCKAHATTYGHISYQATYLKAHYPAEFLAAVIANKAGFYDARTYFEEARRLGVAILPPCVNASDVECRAETKSEVRSMKSEARDGAQTNPPFGASSPLSVTSDFILLTSDFSAARRAALRPGLESVKGLSHATIRRTLQERAVRPFDSLEDYFARVRPGREEMENLILCGAFDSFGITRPSLMLLAERLEAKSEVRSTQRWRAQR